MHQRRLPSALELERQASEAASHRAAASAEEAERAERLAPRNRQQPHTTSEEYAAYVSCALLFAGMVMACVALNDTSWKEEKEGTGRPGPRPGEAFGLRKVHIAGETHNLETMGLVWGCYSSSRCALAFTIIGVLFTAWAFARHTAFIRNSRGTLVGLMVISTFVASWYLWAIMLYATLFPQVPFHGDLFYLTLGQNFTVAATHDGRIAHTQPQTHAWQQQQQQHEALLLMRDNQIPSLHSIASDARPPYLEGDSQLGHQWLNPLADVPDFPVGGSSGSSGVPSFPTPVGGNDPYTEVPSPAMIAKQTFYAQTAYDHLTSQWRLGKGYYLVLAAACSALLMPFLGAVLLFVWWLYERHKAAEVQSRWAIPLVALLWAGWFVAVVGFASRHWKWRHPSADWHLGLDQVVLDSAQWTITDFAFPDDVDARVQQSSAAALAFGVIGVIVGFFACVVSIYHVYDAALEPVLTFILCTLTAGSWLISLIAYGAGTPHYIGGHYWELGYSFWLVLAGTIVMALPLVALILWTIARRAQRTTRDERIMAIPSALALLGVMFTMAALGSDVWSVRAGSEGSNHLGLLRGRFESDWMLRRELARRTDPAVISAGTATLVLLLCGVVIQASAALLGLNFVRGDHMRCGGRAQMPLLATALSLSTLILYVLGAVAYERLLPWDKLPDGYELSHSWRVQVTAAAWTLLSTAAFAYLAQPPEPGEPNILAAAISPPPSRGGKV